MRFRAGMVVAFLALAVGVAGAQSLSDLAPADEYFGHARLSVLGIANIIRDAGTHLDEGYPAWPIINGPLAAVTDAIHAWEWKYPRDPWIAKNLLNLERVYLRVPTQRGQDLAATTESWLASDYPNSGEAAQGRVAIGMPQNTNDDDSVANDSWASSWARYAAMRHRNW